MQSFKKYLRLVCTVAALAVVSAKHKKHTTDTPTPLIHKNSILGHRVENLRWSYDGSGTWDLIG